MRKKKEKEKKKLLGLGPHSYLIEKGKVSIQPFWYYVLIFWVSQPTPSVVSWYVKFLPKCKRVSI